MGNSQIINKTVLAEYQKLIAKLGNNTLARHGKHTVIRLNDDGTVVVVFYKTDILFYKANGTLDINCYAEIKTRFGVRDGSSATGLFIEKAINSIADKTVLVDYESEGPQRYSTQGGSLPKGITLLNNNR